MTTIEWTEKTWNPISGCNKVSPGCAHCYAESVAKRFWGDRKFSDVQFHPDRLQEPLKRRKPTTWFVNSMSDLFHEAVTDEQLDQIFAVMARSPQHTYQCLTKRPQRMLEYLSTGNRHGRILLASKDNEYIPGGMYPLAPYWPLPNVWLGVSVENQKAANERIPLLLEAPAVVRFLSCEPLLEDVSLTFRVDADGRNITDLPGLWDEGDCKIDWVIVGGESGNNARPFDASWARSLIRQCKAASVPVFIKQMGSNPYGKDLAMARITGKGNNPEEWPEDLRVRETP